MRINRDYCSQQVVDKILRLRTLNNFRARLFTFKAQKRDLSLADDEILLLLPLPVAATNGNL